MKVSVLLCTYNGERFLEQQLNSILNQTTLPNQVIIADDCSTDSTRFILRNFQASAPFQVSIYVNEIQLGYAKNYLTYFVKTEGDIVLFCDQDDIWLPNKIAEFVRVFSKDPFLALVFSNAELIDEYNDIISRDYLAFLKMYAKWDNKTPDLLHYFLRNNTFVNGCFMAVSKKVRDKVEQFFADYPTFDLQTGHDQFIANLVALSFPNDFVREIYYVLVKHRIHGEQTMGNSYGQEIGLKEKLSNKKAEKREHLQEKARHLQRLSEMATLLQVNHEEKPRIQQFMDFNERRIALIEKNKLAKVLFTVTSLLTRRYNHYNQFALKEAVRDIL